MTFSLYDHTPFTSVMLSDASNLVAAGVCLFYAGMLIRLSWRISLFRGSVVALAIVSGLFGLAFVAVVVIDNVPILDFRAWLRLLFLCFVIGHIGFVYYYVTALGSLWDSIHDYNNGSGRRRVDSGPPGDEGERLGADV